jgi:hypothetical protein
MPTVNQNSAVDMKPIWQQVEPWNVTDFFAVSNLYPFGGNDVLAGRYFYYPNPTYSVRYDTYANAYSKFRPLPATPLTSQSPRFVSKQGTRGRVISCPSNTTLTVPSPQKNSYLNKTIRIIAGTGAGQIRTISAVADPVVVERGVVTAITDQAGPLSSSITDSSKKWKFNQWSGYNCRFTKGTAGGTCAKILFNSASVLTFGDSTWIPIDYFNSTRLAAPVPVANQTHFVIESVTITVSVAWTTNPDYTSVFMVESGGMFDSWPTTTGSFHVNMYYDSIYDRWSYPLASSLSSTSTQSGFEIEPLTRATGVLDSGTATGGANYTLTDAAKAWTVDQYRNYRVDITGGTGEGQSRRIICNTSTILEVEKRWSTNPDATSTYSICHDYNSLWIFTNGGSVLSRFDIEDNIETSSALSDSGLPAALACKLPGLNQKTIAITSGVRATGGITSVVATPTAAGTGYVRGDILTVTTGGTNGKVIVEETGASGAVLTISLLATGATYTTGAGKATSGGTGAGCTIEISTVGVCCSVITAISHNFRIGDQVVLSGDAAYAGTVTILGVDALTQFQFATAAAGSMTAASSQSTTLVVDCTKNWTTNEHVGKILVYNSAPGTVPNSCTAIARYITANTATTLTVNAMAGALTNGTQPYAISEANQFGREDQYPQPVKSSDGHATAGTATTLTDTTKTWWVNQWAGYKFRVIAGTGRDYTVTIVSNTATVLTYTAPGFTPDTTTHYQILDTFGQATGAGSTTTLNDTAKNWTTNMWVNKKVKIIAGTGFGYESTISANTATQLTFATVAPGTDATTVYTIVDGTVRGAGADRMIWLYGYSGGKYIFIPRSNQDPDFDFYNISSDRMEVGKPNIPNSETIREGSYFAYDGDDRIYYTVYRSNTAANSTMVLVYDLGDSNINAFGTVPNLNTGTANNGNRMEIVQSPAGIKYLYTVRQGGTDFYRAQIYF